MVDSRFFDKAHPLTLGAIASHTGAKLSSADASDIVISSVAPLDTAGAGDLSFLDNTKYIEAFTRSKAGACFVRAKFAHHAPAGMMLLITEQPYASFAIISALFYPSSEKPATIHPSAIIDPQATIAKNVRVEAGAVIEAGAEIHEGALIGANSVIGHGVVIGAGTQIGALCSITHAIIGKQCIIHRSVQIGQDGFGFAPTATGLLKVPQLGRVMIGDHVEIGSNSCIDRGAGPDTIIGTGTKIDNLVQIGHNVVIGNHCVIVSQVGISGSTVIGDGAMLGGQAGFSGHLHIGSGAKIAAQSGVITDVPAGATFGGYPAIAVRDWHRQTVALSKLIKSPLREDE